MRTGAVSAASSCNIQPKEAGVIYGLHRALVLAQDHCMHAYDAYSRMPGHVGVFRVGAVPGAGGHISVSAFRGAGGV